MVTAIAAAAALTAAGCGGQSVVSRPAAASSYSGVVDVSVLHFAASDYVAAKDLAENAKADWADVIVSGTVEGFAAGRSHRIAPNSPPAHKIVLRVNVDQKLKGAAKYTTDGKVYVELWAGSDANPARFEKAVPKGTKVVVFGSEVLMANDAGTEGAGNGHPAGTLLLSGLHPQSLFFEGIPAAALTTKSGAAIAPTVIPGQESLQDLGPEWTKIQTLGGLLGAIKAGLNGS